MHTLMPAMALRRSEPLMVFGSMGGDGQAQTHLQLLMRIVLDGWGPQEAVAAPRWVVDPGDWSVTAESRFDPALIEALGRRGHRISITQAYDSLLGHAHVIRQAPEGYVAGTDPRAEGAALGL
jgi:gamma-glutamyltranspeptidase/glutathione hydrolase